MGGKKKTKKKKSIVAPPMKSMRKARAVTSQFHVLTQAQEAARIAGDDEAAAAASRALEELGGRDAYQKASILTTSRSKHTSKWVFSLLTKHGQRPARGQAPLRTLEVGAVNAQILSVPWLDTLAIDINSQLPQIKQVDFFDLTPEGEFQVIVCSMVINCVPTPVLRGRMLRLLHAHLRPGGILFMMLPLRCLSHSPHITWQRFVKMMTKVGFLLVETKCSPRVAFFCMRRQTEAGDINSAEDIVPEEAAAAIKSAKKKTSTFSVKL